MAAVTPSGGQHWPLAFWMVLGGQSCWGVHVPVNGLVTVPGGQVWQVPSGCGVEPSGQHKPVEVRRSGGQIGI